MIFLEELTGMQRLVMEVLAARAKLGQPTYEMTTSGVMREKLVQLEREGLIATKKGTISSAHRAVTLTEEGRTFCRRYIP